jgi:hypothetical protein
MFRHYLFGEQLLAIVSGRIKLVLIGEGFGSELHPKSRVIEKVLDLGGCLAVLEIADAAYSSR